jgi:hypothetical protein
MTTKQHGLLVLAAALLLGACGAPPPAGDAAANQEDAIRFALNYYFAPQPSDHLPVRLVQPDCTMADSGQRVGFTAEGGCYTGLTLEGEGVYVSRMSDRYSRSSLCHELMHALIGDQGHTRQSAWGAADAQTYGPPGLNGYGGQVAACMTALSLHPELDAIDMGGAL